MSTRDNPTDGLSRGTYDAFTNNWQFVDAGLPELHFHAAAVVQP